MRAEEVWAGRLLGRLLRGDPGSGGPLHADLRGCALRRSGQVVGWGSNEYGESRVPAGRYTQISAGGEHSCALTTDGQGVCWGSNSSGQRRVRGGRYVQISAWSDHSCAVTTDGQGVCWGLNSWGQSTVPAGRYTQTRAGPLPAGCR